LIRASDGGPGGDVAREEDGAAERSVRQLLGGSRREKAIMTLLELLLLLLIAGVCGAIGQAIAGTSRGLVVSIAVGFVGALLGSWMARGLGLPELFTVELGGTSFPIVWSIVGSALFVAVVALISGRTYPRRRWT
jgi:uncharacterized membrane protein YeaQ/YmgE (transglycosylase-associated protein family)